MPAIRSAYAKPTATTISKLALGYTGAARADAHPTQAPPGHPPRRSPLIRQLALVLLLAAPLLAARPNIVVIVSDDQGYGDISCYEHPDEVSTPNMDRIAADGARFSSGYAGCPVCAPTRAGLLTGRYPQRFGFYTAADSRTGLPIREKTIADLLKAAGYRTGVFGKWHLGYDEPFRPLARGFDEFYGFLGHGGHDYFDLAISSVHGSIYRNRKPIDDTGYLTRNLTREAVRFIDENRERPFFLYLPYNAVHNPIQAPEEAIRRHSNPDAKRNTYLAMLDILDEGIGEVLDTLDRRGLSENTLVFFFSENGGARGTTAQNGRLRDYKHSVYEGGIRVPFLMRWPGKIASGTVSDEPVITLDVLPTALAAVGIDVTEDLALDGRDILPVLNGNSEGPLHEALFWNWMDKGSDNGWAVRQGRWKLLADKRGVELYDLAADISERNNLVQSEPEVRARLQKLYYSWRDKLEPRMRRSR